MPGPKEAVVVRAVAGPTHRAIVKHGPEVHCDDEPIGVGLTSIRLERSRRLADGLIDDSPTLILIHTCLEELGRVTGLETRCKCGSAQ